MNEKITCQICGREIKAKNGIMAHHGYQRPYKAGWQTNSCLGARYPPYEISRDRIPYVMKTLIIFLTANKATLKDLLCHPPKNMYISIGGAYAKKTIEVTRPDDFNIEDMHRSYMPKTYDYVFSCRRNELERMIREAQKDYDFLKDRYDTWKKLM